MTEYSLFLFLILLTAIVTLGSIFLTYRRSRDSFHPLVYLGLILFFLYCYIPLHLFNSDLAGLEYFLSPKEMEFVQTLNLLGVISLCMGVLFGDKGANRLHYSRQAWILPPNVSKRINQAAIFFGLVGVASYLYGIVNVGGFAAAYGQSYGGGWSNTGYLREAIHWTLPALLWLMTTHVQTRLSKLDWGWITLFSLPLLMQGLLGARRGPTGLIIITLFMGWYLIRRRRPSLQKLIIGGVTLGMLLLFLLTNRGEIYLGSDFNLKWQLSENNYVTQATPGNEFIYGSGVILDATFRDNYYWGGRYITNLFIRPIPRQIWPTQYEYAAKLFGTPNLEKSNAGTGGAALEDATGWAGPRGAAAGIIADLWIEFWWYFTIALFIIGWLYGMVWRKTVIYGKLWIPIYTVMAALSIYFMQGFGAIAFRFLFMGAAIWLTWLYGKRAFAKKATPEQDIYLNSSEDSRYSS